MIQEYSANNDDTCEDLTLHWNSSQSSSQCIRVLSMDLLKPKLPAISCGEFNTFDLTYSDDDVDWTWCKSPSWSISSSDSTSSSNVRFIQC